MTFIPLTDLTDEKTHRENKHIGTLIRIIRSWDWYRLVEAYTSLNIDNGFISQKYIRPILIHRKQQMVWRWDNTTPALHHCKHGNYIGDPFGADILCGACEDDERPHDLQFPWD